VVLETPDDVVQVLKAECEENTCRKNLTPEEAVSIGLLIEDVEREFAKKSQQEGRRKGDPTIVRDPPRPGAPSSQPSVRRFPCLEGSERL